jgi:hypothetical protein
LIRDGTSDHGKYSVLFEDVTFFDM